MMKIFLRIALLTFLSMTYAQATETESPFKCNPTGNQSELNQCAFDDYTAADKKLNYTWKQLMNNFKADKTATAKLKAAQKAWLVFRDAEIDAMFACDTKEDNCWGSMEPMQRFYEKAALTEARTARLQHYLNKGLGVAMD
ncbi:MAG TPA: lysozyme inhibitor LprI family protein [Thiolinea sp.]|nr:lysozyme inhibitor LprI family protein [Thiolinea sp.]